MSSHEGPSEQNERIDAYLRYTAKCRELPPSPKQPGIELLVRRDEIVLAEEAATRDLEEHRLPREWGHIGIAYEDKYLTILRDPVRFPDRTLGTYIRVLNRNADYPGVAILPVCEGKIVLLEHYRHATQDWHWEIPRGFGETPSAIENARLEMREELGTDCAVLKALGSIHTNTGVLSERVELFYAEVNGYAKKDEREAIGNIHLFDAKQVEDMILADKITDSFSIAALFRAQLAKLI